MGESTKDLFDFYIGSQERATPTSHETVRVNYEDFLTLRRVVTEELDAKDAEIESLAAERDELRAVVDLFMSATLNSPEVYREFGEIAASLGKESGLYKLVAGQIQHAREAAEAAREAGGSDG